MDDKEETPELFHKISGWLGGVYDALTRYMLYSVDNIRKFGTFIKFEVERTNAT